MSDEHDCANLCMQPSLNKSYYYHCFISSHGCIYVPKSDIRFYHCSLYPIHTVSYLKALQTVAHDRPHVHL